MTKYLDETGLSHFWGNIKAKSVRAFATVADMQGAADLADGMTCHTNGFHTSGDGGAAYYTVSESGTANGMDVLALQGGLVAHQVVQEFGNKVGTTSDFAREMVSNVAMSYVLRRDEFTYDDEHDLFHGDGAQVGGKYQICCSAFVMAVINGIPFESSKYNGGTNEINGFGFCDSSLIEFYESDTDRDEEYWKFSNHLAKYLNERGYCYVPEPDLSNVQTGDVLFFSLEGGGDDPTSGYMGINHSTIFRDVYNDNMYSVWEVGTIPTLAQYPLTYLENNPVVLACRPPYKDFEKLPNVKNAVRYSSFSTASNVPIVGVDGFKKGQCYTVDFDVTYDYDEAQGQTYHYPAVMQTDGTTLFNAHGGTEIKNHYTLFVTPTADVADLLIQTRASATGLSNAGTLSNLLVVDGFHPEVRYKQPYTNSLFTAASGYTVNSRMYKMGDFVALYLDAKTLAPNSAQVIGYVTSTITPMPIIPCPAIAVTASGTFPAAAWVRNDGAVCCKYTGNSDTITDFYISILLPTELKAQS